MQAPALEEAPRGATRPGRKAGTEVSILELLQSDEKAILDEALPAVGWLEHYGRDGRERTRERLAALYRLVEQAVRTRDLEPLLAHARAIAAERNAQGYDPTEVRSAFSALEQAIWHRAFGWLPPSEWAYGLGLVGTALDHARKALVESFETARATGPRYVDMSRIYRGAEPPALSRPIEELVYPA